MGRTWHQFTACFFSTDSSGHKTNTSRFHWKNFCPKNKMLCFQRSMTMFTSIHIPIISQAIYCIPLEMTVTSIFNQREILQRVGLKLLSRNTLVLIVVVAMENLREGSGEDGFQHYCQMVNQRYGFIHEAVKKIRHVMKKYVNVPCTVREQLGSW